MGRTPSHDRAAALSHTLAATPARPQSQASGLTPEGQARRLRLRRAAGTLAIIVGGGWGGWGGWGGLAALGGLGGLSGCGFAPRQPPRLPFQRLMLEGLDARSAIALPLRQQLREAGVQLVGSAAQADAVLHTLAHARQQSVAASTGAGQVRELSLRVRYAFALRTPDGRTLLPPAELQLQRDQSYNEQLALAKQQEQDELYAAMEADLVQQVLRRLARAPRVVDVQPEAGR